MVREWGLSPEIGPVGYGSERSGRDHPLAGRSYAEATQHAIDGEDARLLRRAEATAVHPLTQNRRTLDRVVALLLERETIDGADLYALTDGRPVSPAHLG